MVFSPLHSWSGKRKKGGPNKDVNERQRLNHKYKRELKAAIREVKRDNEVLARHQLETIIQKLVDFFYLLLSRVHQLYRQH